MNEDEIKQLQRQVSKLQLEAKLRKSVANELERQKNLVQQAKEEAEKQRAILKVASDRLSKYLSPQICDQILRGESFSGIQNSRKYLTVFFSDIVNFTAISEKMDPDELGRFLNYYLTKMSELALNYGGTIDKFIGDSVMIFFGDPISEGAHKDANNCFNMALAMQEFLASNRIAIQQKYNLPEPLHIRVGIHSGNCNVGNFGSEQRLEYTAIGRVVNIAARLEQACGVDSILCSQDTHELIDNKEVFSEETKIFAKGVTEEISTYSWNAVS